VHKDKSSGTIRGSRIVLRKTSSVCGAVAEGSRAAASSWANGAEPCPRVVNQDGSPRAAAWWTPPRNFFPSRRVVSLSIFLRTAPPKPASHSHGVYIIAAVPRLTH
jgi:hypothetical protein